MFFGRYQAKKIAVNALRNQVENGTNIKQPESDHNAITTHLQFFPNFLFWSQFFIRNSTIFTINEYSITAFGIKWRIQDLNLAIRVCAKMENAFI